MLIAVYSIPSSGQVWLTRLLADAIGCPTYTWLPQDGGRDIALEGLDRESPHRVTRAHSIQHLNWPTADAVVHLIRDPRDVIVSTYHFRYANETIEAAADEVLASWNDYAQLARDEDPVGQRDAIVSTLRYEDLRQDPAPWIAGLLWGLGLTDQAVPSERLLQAIGRQSMEARRHRPPAGSEFVQRTHRRHIRKGLVGEGRVALGPALLERVERECDPELLEHFGYA